MIYTPATAARDGAQVYDMTTGAAMQKVLAIDTEKREVVLAEVPLRVEGDDVATVTRRFERIDVIVEPLTRYLVSAHCYGEVKSSPSAQTVPATPEGGGGVG